MGARLGLALAFALAAQGGASEAAKAPTRLFADEQPIKVTLRGPISAVASTPGTLRTARPATLELALPAVEQHAIQLSPRGKTRRQKERCNFPPLRVEFVAKPPKTSFFDGQKRLKLVTHCRASAQHQQYVLLEYAVYRMFNALSPHGLRARLGTFDYVEASGKTVASRLGFFTENPDDAASRNGLKEATVGTFIRAGQLDPAAAARAALFEYMIGNTDWSMRQAPPGGGCCHNFRMLGADKAQSGLIPVPYDFDSSGFVNAPYAAPAEQLGLSSVRDRQYRGYCMHNVQALAAAAEFRAKKGQVLAAIAGVPQLDEGRKRGAASYLEGFFRDIATDEDVRKRVLKTCIS
jgi:hypothetical protein